MSEHPDYRLVDQIAEHLGVPVGAVLGACDVLGLDATNGVHQSFIEPIRQVILQWIREGRI